MAPKYTADKATLLDYKKKLKCGIATLGAGIIVASSVGLGAPASFAAELTVDGRNVIDTGTTQTDAENSVNGYVTYNRNGNANNRDVDNAVPMEGVIVYAQWFERDGTASPIYKGTTGADGSFHIVMEPYRAPDGSTKSFDADALLPEGEKFRIWAVNPDSSTYDLLFQYMNGQVGPETYIFETNGGASYDLGPNRLNNINIQFADAKDPDGMHNIAAATDNAKEGLEGNVNGKVFWNNRVLAGGLDYGTLSDFNNGDVAAAGVNVYGSYLSDAGIAKIMAEAPAAIGTSNIRGFGWTMQNEADLQAWIKQQIAVDGKDFWIAETAHAVTDANGDYSLQFNGTYGTSWDNVGTFADANAEALKGTVAASPSEGRWATSAGGASRIGSAVSKHINKDWLFISTERTEGISQITEWRNNWYMGPSANFGVTTPHYTSLNNADFALQPEQISFDVTPYDSYNNYGVAGDTVQTTTTGLPGAFLSNMQYEIEWTDQDGNIVKPGSDCRFNVSPTGTIPSCDFTAPADLTEQTTYVAKLYAVDPEGNRAPIPLAQDSFTVDPNKKLTDGIIPSYDNTLVVPGTPATSSPTLTDADDNPATAPEGTKYSIPDSYTPPAGYTVTIDENTGVVTVTSPDSPTGDTAETLDVPVLVTYPDTSTDEVTAPFQLDTDGDGTPDVTDEDDDNDGFTDQEETDAGTNPKDDQSTPDTTAPVVDPIDDQTGTVGEPITPITVTTDDPTANVEVTGLPDGVTYDPATGEITGTPTTPGTSTVTVTVTDNDGNATTEEFTFTVNEAPVEPTTPITDENDPSYPDTGLPQGEFLIVETPTNSDGSALPNGTEFTGVEGNPDWATVNPDGTVTLTPGTDVTPGIYPITVDITYTDGTDDRVTFDVTVTEVTTPPVDPTQADNNDPGYTNGSGEPGSTVTIPAPVNSDGSNVPDDSTFTSSNPDVAVDPNTGEVTVTIPEGANPDDTISSVIIVTYPDGTTDEVPVSVVVTEPAPVDTPDNQENDPSYTGVTVDQGGNATIGSPTNPDGTTLPDGSTFNGSDNNPDWVTVNPDGSITVTPGTDVPAGNYPVEVTVTYPDKTTDVVRTQVTVNEAPVDPVDPATPVADNNSPSYSSITVDPGTSTTIGSPTNPDGSALPDGTDFNGGDGNPSWVTVNPDGSITVTPGTDVPAGNYPVEVTVTYPDGSTDVVRTQVTVNELPAPSTPVADDNDPTYTNGAGNPGTTVTVPSPTNPDGSALPDGSTFTSSNPNVAVDPNTGEVTFVIPDDATPGTIISTVITVTYPDGSTDVVPVSTLITEPTPVDTTTDADDNTPVYTGGDVEKGSSTTIPAPKNEDGSDLPSGTTFTGGEGTPGWVTVNPDGSVTVTPGDDVPAGDYTIPVLVTYPDGSTETVTVTITVTNPVVPDAETNNPSYTDGSGDPGTTVTIPAPKNEDGSNVPDGSTFTSDNPNIAVDPNTGEVTVTVPEDATPGTPITGTITVTYPDGTTDEIPVSVDVTTPVEPVAPVDDNQSYIPHYNNGVTVDQGGNTTIPVPTYTDGDRQPTEAPDGTTYTGAEGNPDWATVNPDGSITVTPGADVPSGRYVVVVNIKFPDGTMTTVPVPVIVNEVPVDPAEPTTPDNYTYSPNYTGTTVKQGDTAVIAVPTFTTGDGETVTTPEGTTFTGVGTPSWITVNPDGSITVTPGKDVEPGYYPVTVEITYPDGTKSGATVLVQVVGADETSTPVDPTDPNVPVDPTDPDDGNTDGGSTDGGNTDGGTTDGGSTDGGNTDGGSTDGGSTDGGSTDGGSTDGGSTDGGTTDGGSTDGGNTDGGTTDGGTTDGGSTDGGTTDGGTTDGGTTDGGSTDGGNTDGGSTDGGNTDSGKTDNSGNNAGAGSSDNSGAAGGSNGTTGNTTSGANTSTSGANTSKGSLANTGAQVTLAAGLGALALAAGGVILFARRRSEKA